MALYIITYRAFLFRTNDQKTNIVEMCITGYGIMDNSIHSTWKSQSAAFPRPANRVTHNSMIQSVIHITHNADYYGIQLIFSQNKICFYRKRL